MQCIRCDKKIKMMKEPFEANLKEAVDVLLYPHYGSTYADMSIISGNSSSATVVSKWAVICDGCYGKLKDRLTRIPR